MYSSGISLKNRFPYFGMIDGIIKYSDNRNTYHANDSGQGCSVSKVPFDLTVTREGRYGPTKCNNIGIFEQIVEPKRPSGNCQVNCFLNDRTGLNFRHSVCLKKKLVCSIVLSEFCDCNLNDGWYRFEVCKKIYKMILIQKYLKSSSMSSTLASRLFDDLSFRSSSFILFCIIMVFLVIFSPGRPMRSAHGIHCRKMHLTYYKIDLVHYPIKTILDISFFFHMKNLTYDMCDIMLNIAV